MTIIIGWWEILGAMVGYIIVSTIEAWIWRHKRRGYWEKEYYQVMESWTHSVDALGDAAVLVREQEATINRFRLLYGPLPDEQPLGTDPMEGT